MTIRQKLQKLWDRTLTIKGRTVKLVPLMILLMIVTGASAAMILHFSLSVDTTGEIVLNPYYIKLTDLADTQVDTVPFGQVMQGYEQWTDEYKLVLVNPELEVHVAFRIAGSLATGVLVGCYDNSTGTPVEWQEGESFVKMMGDGNPTVLVLAFLVSADYSASAGSIGDFDLVWDAYEYYDPTIPASCDVLKTGSSEAHFWADEAGTGGDLVSFLWTGVYADGVMVWTADMYLANMRGGTGTIAWTWVLTAGPPTGVTVAAMVEQLDGTMAVWDQSTILQTQGVDNSNNVRTIRWSIVVPEGYTLGDILLGMTLDGTAT